MKSEYEIKVTGMSANWTFGTIKRPDGEVLVFQVKKASAVALPS